MSTAFGLLLRVLHLMRNLRNWYCSNIVAEAGPPHRVAGGPSMSIRFSKKKMHTSWFVVCTAVSIVCCTAVSTRSGGFCLHSNAV